MRGTLSRGQLCAHAIEVEPGGIATAQARNLGREHARVAAVRDAHGRICSSRCEIDFGATDAHTSRGRRRDGEMDRYHLGISAQIEGKRPGMVARRQSCGGELHLHILIPVSLERTGGDGGRDPMR